MNTTPDGGMMNRTTLKRGQLGVCSAGSGGKRVANSPSEKRRLSKHTQGFANKDEQREDPDSHRAFEQNLEVLRIEMIQPRWEFPGVVESVERRLIVAH